MKIGIIGAMEQEIEIFKNKIENIQVTKIFGKTFYEGTWHNKQVVLTQSGIGKVYAALATQTIINHFGGTHVINSGVAGAISEKLIPGDIVVSTDLVYHDVDVTGFGYPHGQVPGTTSLFFEADKKMIDLVSDQNIYTGRIATGDQFISDSNKKQWIRETFEPMCVEMEGAAIGHVCGINKTPFVVIRAISDTASGDAEEEFADNLQKGVERATGITEYIVENL